ncbi:Small subunit ribosomal protein S16 [Planctomycetales bacterium 10988]|nr:Small subunit ribosomal protein S16 [Planctomycetales bacterium 10988]
MAVRIRMKKMGRTHRPFFRICAADSRSPRDGRVIEELGTYDPMVADNDAQVSLDRERVAYWLSVGAQPSEKVAILINKYGPEGTRVKENDEARSKFGQPKTPAMVAAGAAPAPAAKPAVKKEEPKAEEPAAEEPAEGESPKPEAPVEEKPAE